MTQFRGITSQQRISLAPTNLHQGHKMTTNNPSYVPTQHPQHNFVQNAQVCITYIYDVPLLSYISMQTLGGRDHELWPNEHQLGIDSVGLYPAVNHADALPRTRYTNAMGNEDPPHVAIVSIRFISPHAPFVDCGCAEADGPWTTSREPRSTST
jgi:hypothetical protein